MSVPNQKKIIIQRTSETDKKDFFKISNKNLAAAARKLDGKAFKLFIYFADNARGYTVELYPVDFCNWASLSRSSYQRAREDLVAAGYIIKSEKAKNLYLFKEESNNIEHDDIVESVGGELYEEKLSKYFPNQLD